MATKKYVSLEKLGLYDQKIKGVISAGDEATLAAAQQFATNLGTNYDVAGAAAGVQAKLDAEIERAKAAEEAASAAASKAQGDVDGLKTYVGTIPTTAIATDVIGYVQEKTAGIATDAALEELTGRVAQTETNIGNITKDYLTSADKTELSDAIASEASRADTAEKANAAAIKVISDDYLKGADKTALQEGIDGVAADVAEIAGDYLKASDKTELQGKIDLKAAQTALDAEVQRATQAEAGLQTQINTIMNNPETDKVIDSINEFTAWIDEHGGIADGMRADIDKNKEDIAAMDTAYKAADTEIKGRLDTLEAIDHEAYVAADTALENKLNAEIAKKADTTAVEANAQAIAALQEAVGEDGSVQDKIEAAVAVETQAREAAIAEVQEDADKGISDAAAALKAAQDASAHADTLNTAMDERMAVVEGKAHEHGNKALLDTYTQTEANLADAVAKKHEHSNLTVLEGITAEQVTAWDKVTNKADQTALQGEIDRATAAEQALGARIDEFVEVSEEEINALFA